MSVTGRRPSRRSVTGWKILPEVRNWMGDPPGGPELAGRPVLMSGSGRETLPEVRKWLGDPSEGPEVVGGPPGGP